MRRPRSKERSISTGTLRSAGQQIDLATLLEEHSYPVPGLNWLPADLLPGWIQTYGMECGPEAIAPWNPNFEFGVTAVLGEGADVFHGTPNDDSAESNFTAVVWKRFTPSGPLVPVPTAPGDESVDMLCGGDGDDELFGDADDNWTVGEEWLDGGAGDDYCDGDPPNSLTGPAGGTSSDLAKSTCEVSEHAATGAWVETYPGFSCADSSNPVEELGL